MAAITGLITTGVAVSKATGFKPLKAIGSLFGGSDPNRGTADLADTIDNYEGIGRARAQAIADQVIGWIRAGTSDAVIYSRIKDIRGVSQSRNLSNDPKYRLVQAKIDQIRQQLKSNQGGGNVPQTPSNFAASRSGGNGSGIDWKNPAIYLGGGAAAVALIFLVGNILNK